MQQRYDGGADPTRQDPALYSVAVSERAGREQVDLDHAVNGLRRSHPELSAGKPTWLWQKWALSLLLPALAMAAVLAPEQAMFALAGVLVLPFFCVVALRVAALRGVPLQRRGRVGAARPCLRSRTAEWAPAQDHRHPAHCLPRRALPGARSAMAPAWAVAAWAARPDRRLRRRSRRGRGPRGARLQ